MKPISQPFVLKIVQDSISVEKHFIMGCEQVKVRPSVLETIPFDNGERKSESSNRIKERHSSAVIPTVYFDLSPSDKQAFSATFCQERQRTIDNMAYRKAINHWRPSSLGELVRLIEDLSSSGNQIDRAWIIFYWISQNIRYDTNGYFSNRIGMQNADTVFKTGVAVSEGYSSLYAELCYRTGIKCRTVTGYAKGFGFDVRETKFDRTDHAWNIITLDNGHSYFVEPTWGSGHLDYSSHQYKQELVSHYFLCRPEHMIYGHLPEDDQWQLLAYPLRLEEYLMLPHVYPIFFTLDLYIVSPACSAKVDLVEGEAYGLVLIQTSNNKAELCGVLKDKKGNKIVGGSLTFLDKEDQTLWECRFAPPKPGKYDIFIFAKEPDNQDQSFLTSAIQFAFDIDHLPSPSISYPLIWSQFFDYNLEIIKPANSHYIDWPSNNNTSYAEILVRSPNDVCISATMKDTVKGLNVEKGTLTNFDYETKLWQCLFAPSRAGVSFELTLFAKQLNEQKSHCVAQFDLRPIPKDNLKQCMTFPITYLPFNESKCYLFEPLNGVLQRASTVHFCCRIPGAREVNMTVDGNWIRGNGLKPDKNDVFESDIHVGLREVVVWIKFNNEGSSYEGLLKYTVR
jgi:hypothetical protein